MEPVASLYAIIGANTDPLVADLGKASKALSAFAGQTEQQTGRAAAVFGSNVDKMGASAGRYVDAAGRLREGNGRFVSDATLAAEASGKFGDSLGGASAKMGVFGQANAALAAKFKELDAQRETLDRGFGRLGETAKGVGSALTTYVSLPLLAIGGFSVNAGADFEKGMNRVEAATMAAGAELEQLEQKAKAIALDPKLKFSAEQAADALAELAKNGLSSGQILDGAADAAVNLATATGGQLAGAANITTDVMAAFGKKAGELAGVVDSITGATIASKFGIEDYAGALAQAGAVAGQSGVGFEEFNTALAVTAAGFSSGSDAGTSLKTFFQRLVPQTKEAALSMERLGLKFFDAQGSMKPLRTIAGDLQKAFKGLSDEQKNLEGNKIFGADSIRTALLLAKDGTAGFDEMAKSIGKVNAASQGAILSKGFAGSLEGFKSALEGLGIAIAESGLLDIGARFLRTAGDLAGGLAQLDPAFLSVAVAVGAVVAAIGPLAFAVGTVLANLGTLKSGFSLLSSAATGLVSPIGLAVVALGALAAAAVYFAESGERAVSAYEDQAKATQTLTSSINPLVERYEELKSKTTLTAAEQEELRGIIKQIAQQVPSAVTAVDQYGVAMDISAGKTREFSAAQRELEKQLAIKALPAAEAQLKDFGLRLAALRKQQDEFNKNGGIKVVEFDSRGISSTVQVYKAGSEKVQQLQLDLATLNVRFQEQQALVDKLRGSAGKFGEALPGFEKYGKLAKQAAAEIAALGKSTDAVVGGGKGLAGYTEEQSKALQKLRGALQQVDKEAEAGINFDPIGDKIQVLASGIPNILAAGFAPKGKVTAAFVAQLNDLEAEYDKLKERIAKKQRDFLVAPIAEKKPDFGTVPETVSNALPDEFGTGSITLSPIEYKAYQDSQAAILEGNREFIEGFALDTEQMTQINAALANSIASTAAEAVGILGDAFGAVVSGASSVGDGLRTAFFGILGLVGDFLVDFGKLVIQQAVLTVAANALATNPLTAPLAIPIALAAIAVGSAIRGVAKKGMTSGGGGSAPSLPSAGSFPSSSTSPNGNARQEPLVIDLRLQPVELRQKGPDMAGVLAFEQYRKRRVS